MIVDESVNLGSVSGATLLNDEDGVSGETIVIDTADYTPIPALLPQSGPLHIGIVVPDLDRAMEGYRQLFGWKWTSTVRARHELSGPCAAEAELHVAFASGSPHVELIEDRPDTIWSARNGPLHHLGCWVSDLREAGEILTHAGFALRGRGRRVGTTRFAYAIYGNENGLLVEIQDAHFRPGWQAWMDGAT